MKPGGIIYVRRFLCEFAQAASRTTSGFKAKFQALIVGVVASDSSSHWLGGTGGCLRDAGQDADQDIVGVM